MKLHKVQVIIMLTKSDVAPPTDPLGMSKVAKLHVCVLTKDGLQFVLTMDGMNLVGGQVQNVASVSFSILVCSSKDYYLLRINRCHSCICSRYTLTILNECVPFYTGKKIQYLN